MIMQKKRLGGFFYMSCALERYLSCEAHLGPAWSFSEGRQGAKQTKTNYASALGAPEDTFDKKDCGSILRGDDLLEVDKDNHFFSNSNMISQI